jgi:glycosyltransferase 2 family protein
MTARTGRLPKTLLYLAVHAVGLAVFGWILWQVDLSSLAGALERFGVVPFAIGGALVSGLFVCKAVRWMLICRALGGKLGLFDAVAYYVVAVCFSVVTPGRVGDFAKAVFLQRSGAMPMKPALLATFADRIWDVLVLGCAGLLGLLRWGGLSGVWQWVAAAAVGLLPVLFFFPEVWVPPVHVVAGVSQRLAGRVDPLLESLRSSIRLLRGGVGLAALGLSVVSFAMLVGIAQAFVQRTAEPLGVAETAAAVAVANILSFLPITVAGMGTRELVYVQAWSQGGQGKAPAVAVSLGYFLVVYVGTAVLGAVLYLTTARKLLGGKGLKSVVDAAQQRGDE